ncbi:hypothetical protein TBR22_A03680 [Luteitalea sp. TBR-22]|uniref:DcaP family trimeric outer membrane transporter n=1 Tax=Luteitalea sp. TBR-22 TaxID=2802971 RepID=UPI001AF3D06A|nr:DcaP family trimeric outer membrane transporter [Luteitalea sp. TBR-22]BCS31168.1 hypothetical protein TBR22_A03680 [Luteitalea sp. TBR-22]
MTPAARTCVLLVAGLSWLAPARVGGQPAAADAPPPRPHAEIYGAAMLDIGYDFKQINPDWFDTMKVTQLPKSPREFGEDGRTYAGVRQSRFGVKTGTPTALGELTTWFEFEMFGVGVDAGQTTFRLRHAYGELGAFGAGQTWSAFMDIDVFPNSIEYWGPTGMVLFRNVQVRYMPVRGTHDVVLAVERPGASGDEGPYGDRIQVQNVQTRNPLPDFTGAYKYTGDGWGYVRVGGALRRLQWDDLLEDQFTLGGNAVGWGLNLSANVNAGKRDVLRLQFVFGEGIQNYMNDAPVDVAIQNNFADPRRPLLGKPLPVTGLVAFLDHKWSNRWSSTVGYSRTDIDNTDGQTADAYGTGQYALLNLLHYPAPNVMVGGELQYGRRTNAFDGFSADGLKLQFSFKYNFSWKLGG